MIMLHGHIGKGWRMSFGADMFIPEYIQKKKCKYTIMSTVKSENLEKGTEPFEAAFS